MSRRHKSQRKFWRRKWRSLYLWHRYLGLIAGLLVVILSVTGVMLNHTDQLRLSAKYVSSPWMLDWYGIAPKEPPVSFPLSPRGWLSSVDGRLFLNGQHLGEVSEPIVGAVATDKVIAVAMPAALFLYTGEGELIERLEGISLPGEIDAIGNGNNGAIVLKTDKGMFAADEFVTAWSPAPEASQWARQGSPPAHINEQVLSVYRGMGLSWERVLLDLHSGRIMGDWGLYLMDGAALILLFLSGTGVYIWLKSKRRRK